MGSFFPSAYHKFQTGLTIRTKMYVHHAKMEKRGYIMKERAERQQYRQREYRGKHLDTSGQPRPDLWKRGIEDLKRLRIAAGVSRTPGGTELAPLGFVGVQWTQIGPDPLVVDQEQNFQGAGPNSGEVTDIAIDPQVTSDQTIYIATNDGGIWKTTDGGTTWTPKTDGMDSLSMGAVALDPGNSSIVYAGTGNLFDGGHVFPNFEAVGIYKSVDGGDTWSVIGASVFTNKGIDRIVLPAPNVLLVATSVGLFRSVDGGQNFGANAPTFNDGNAILSGFCTDLSLDTASPSTVYACIAGLGIFKSTDGGATFPSSANLFSNPGAPSTNGRISFTQSTLPDNQTMYASVSTTTAIDSPYLGLFKSTDGGGHWTTMPDASNRAKENSNQAGYDLTVGVDPQNANRVYIGFEELYLSTDGGQNFATPAISRNQVHFDHHALVFSPRSHWGSPPTQVYVGTDGGIATLINDPINGPTWKNLNAAIATNLFRGIDIGRGNSTNNGFTYGGTQDTGTIEHRSSSCPLPGPGFPGTEWHHGNDGDGGPVAVDPADPCKAYGSRFGGGYIRTTDGGTTWSTGTGLPAGGSQFFLFAVDSNDSTFVYAAVGSQLFQSNDTGATFTSIHNFSTANVSSIATVKRDSNILWVGLDNGTVQFTTNAKAGSGSVWNSPPTQPGVPANHSIEGIAIDPSIVGQVVAVCSGFAGPGVDPSKHVFLTPDNGTTWNDISGQVGGSQNLPDLPLHSVVIDPSTSLHTIIVGSDGGVMRTADQGATWQILGVGLPTVDCTSLAIDADATPPLLRVGTYGRSVFELTRPSGPQLAVIANLGFGTVAMGGNMTLTAQLFNVGSADLHISGFDRSAGSADFQVVSPPSFPVTVPPGGEVDFSVSFQPSSGGNQTATFQISSDDPTTPTRQLPASGSTPGVVPTVTAINPTSGPASGGTSVTITGTGFTLATGASFGSTAASNFTINSDTQIIITSPAANLSGAVDVTVTTSQGTSATGSSDQFTYITAAAPTVTGINPTSGPASGGTNITITGTGFNGATGVSFGSTPASNFTVNSDTQITATSPAANLSGAVDVTVTTPNGTSATGSADQFTYLTATAPTVTGINPTSGPASGGTTVTITGTGFNGATGVSFGSTAASSFNVDSDTQITATSPAANLSGAVDVTITTPNGTSATSSADQFTYITAATPTVTGINPTSGPASGGTSVTITGTGFNGATGVSFGSTAASNFTVDSDTQITATSSVANLSGAVDVTVTTPNGTSATSSADQFTYLTATAPTVTSINPTSGPAAGGDSVTITGTGFTGATNVSFDSTPASSFNVDSDTQITATSPAANLSGAVDVTVTTPNGTSATSTADQFTYM